MWDTAVAWVCALHRQWRYAVRPGLAEALQSFSEIHQRMSDDRFA